MLMYSPSLGLSYQNGNTRKYSFDNTASYTWYIAKPYNIVCMHVHVNVRFTATYLLFSFAYSSFVKTTDVNLHMIS